MAHKYRPEVKVRLRGAPQAAQAAGIVAQWKRARTAAANVERAVRIYDALLRGDTRLLHEFFPLLSVGAGNSAQEFESGAPIVTFAQGDDGQVEADLLDSLGFGRLDFDNE